MMTKCIMSLESTLLEASSHIHVETVQILEGDDLNWKIFEAEKDSQSLKKSIGTKTATFSCSGRCSATLSGETENTHQGQPTMRA